MAKVSLLKKSKNIILLLSALGIIDASYLVFEHYNPNPSGSCGVGPFSGCGPVLTSSYSEIYGIPLAVLGFLYYLSIFSIVFLLSKKKKFSSSGYILIPIPLFAFLFSLCLMYLQIFVIGSICIYCTLSATLSTILFFLIWHTFSMERKKFFINLAYLKYKYILKHLLFLTKPDLIHEKALKFGQVLGSMGPVKWFFAYLFKVEDKSLERTFAGIKFPNPIGLAAGFDYEARLTQIVPSLGFGFMTVGTITNSPYSGNPRPMLGRLPKSKSLLVNKGFKNLGAVKTIKSLEKLDFAFPLGVSIGRTNVRRLKTQKQSVNDVVKTFKLFERSNVKNSFYELNISCPNLFGDISFYPPKNLEELLSGVDKLNIQKPIFVKMPIGETTEDFLEMLKVVDKHKIAGLIIGNLQTDKNDKNLDPEEVKKFKMGSFSGRPTFERSNELIRLTRKIYNKRFVIIGCGGVFNSKNAMEKLRCGVMIVIGMMF